MADTVAEQQHNPSPVNTEIFLEYVRKGRVNDVKACITSGLMTEVVSSTEGTDTPLHIAVTEDSEDMVDVLLHDTNWIMATNMYGETPLHLACRYGKLSYVKSLLHHGAELDPKDCAECSPLFHAVSRNHVAVVQLLIEEGCDLDTLNEELITPLDYAILHNKKEIISLLLKGGCAIDRWTGPVSHPDYLAYSIVFPLWGNCDLKNIQLLVDCGYTTEYSYIRTMLELLHKHYHLDNGSLDMFVKLAEKPQSLVGLSRICIRRVFHARRYLIGGSVDSMINKLELPQKFKNYIAICDS